IPFRGGRHAVSFIRENLAGPSGLNRLPDTAVLLDPILIAVQIGGAMQFVPDCPNVVQLTGFPRHHAGIESSSADKKVVHGTESTVVLGQPLEIVENDRIEIEIDDALAGREGSSGEQIELIPPTFDTFWKWSCSDVFVQPRCVIGEADKLTLHT